MKQQPQGFNWPPSLEEKQAVRADRRKGERTVFIVEFTTKTGKVCETYATYEEARLRVDCFPADGLASMPLIFQDLPDGSQRVVREDGKPLQWHRLAADADGPAEEPLQLSEGSLGLFDAEGKPRATIRFIAQVDDETDASDPNVFDQ